MSKTNKIVLVIATLLLVLGGVAIYQRTGVPGPQGPQGLQGPKGEPGVSTVVESPVLGGSGPTHYQNESFLEGLTVGVGRPFSISRLGVLSTTGTSTWNALVTFDKGARVSYTNSTTTTVAAYTLVENDLAPGGKCYGTFSFTKTVGAAGGGNLSTTTLTTAASSTFANIVPAVGDWCDINVESATSSASQLGMIWAFGTGWDPQTASTTPTGLTINGGDSAKLRIYRKFNTDLGAFLIIGKDAD